MRSALAILAMLFVAVSSPRAAGWVDQLKNRHNQVCCYDNDGRRLDDPEWRIVGNRYEVLFTEGWIAVPDEAVVDMRNQDGIARVWSTPRPEGRSIVCFLPGAYS